jgi:16S rRNA (adenine1518-N6/adenine1519-N6)-dimethyltransferase
MKIEEVRELLSQLQIKPLKSLGQNFLIDSSIIDKIVGYKNFEDYNQIVEIGPGLGSLTRRMDGVKDKLKLIELDKTLASYWAEQGFQVEHEDALKIDWSQLSKPSLLISNLPYQISSRLLVELFCKDAPFQDMVLMFQKEVGDRIKAEPENKKEYGLLSILCDLRWKVRTVTKAPHRAFFPAPEVESIVLSFERREELKLKNSKAFVRHMKELFGSRRKKMAKAFKKHNVDYSEKATTYFEMRPDQVSAKEHLMLYKEIEDSGV